VGDYNLTTANFDKYKKSNNIFVMGISDSSCLGCCTSEEFLNDLYQDFQNEIYTFKGKKIPIARVDLSKKPDFI